MFKLDFCEKDRKKPTDSSQRRTDVPSTESKFVLFQLLVYLVWSEDSISG